MIGASSEDIRLDDVFIVMESVDGDNNVLGTPTKALFNIVSDPFDASATNVLDHDEKSTWKGSQGHSLTISLLQSNQKAYQNSK